MADTMEQASACCGMRRRPQPGPVPDPRPVLRLAHADHGPVDPRPWYSRFSAAHVPLVRPQRRTTCLDRRVPLASSALFWAMLLLARGVDTLVRWWRPRFSISRTLTRVLGYHFMSRVLMSQTRPLQLPDGLLNQLDAVVKGWSEDPHAPAWLNQLEDRLTTHGSWNPGVARSRAAP